MYSRKINLRGVEGNSLPLVEVSRYGDVDAPRKAVMLNVHGADPQWWFEYFGDYVNGDGALFERYLKLEQDAGAMEVAHAAAVELVEMRRDVSALVVDVLVPRGVLDMNRNVNIGAPIDYRSAHSPIRAAFDWENPNNGDLLGRLRDIYGVIVNIVLDQILGADVVLDVHTMNSHSLNQEAAEKKIGGATVAERLKEILDLYTSEDNFGNRRLMNILLSDNGVNGDAGDFDLAVAMEEFFYEGGFGIGVDDPYYLLPFVRSLTYAQLAKIVDFRYGAIDIPISMIADKSCNVEPVLSDSKMMQVGKILAKAASRVLGAAK